MVTIPENDNKYDYRSEVIYRILNDFREKDEVVYYRSAMGALTELFIEVASDFVKKGYYAKVNYFVESWKGVQSVVISKRPLRESNARMVYSRMIHYC